MKTLAHRGSQTPLQGISEHPDFNNIVARHKIGYNKMYNIGKETGFTFTKCFGKMNAGKFRLTGFEKGGLFNIEWRTTPKIILIISWMSIARSQSLIHLHGVELITNEPKILTGVDNSQGKNLYNSIEAVKNDDIVNNSNNQQVNKDNNVEGRNKRNRQSISDEEDD